MSLLMDLDETGNQGACELDSHADTVVAGSNMVMLPNGDTKQRVTVSGYSPDLPVMENIPIASCATAYSSPDTGEVFILVFHQALYFGKKLPHSLLCPNQMRDAGHVVNDTPRQYDDKSTHSIMVCDPDLNYNLNIPLMLQGVISCFCSRQPTTEELNPGNCEWITMTMDEPWDPTSTRFKSREEELIPATTMF